MDPSSTPLKSTTQRVPGSALDHFAFEQLEQLAFETSDSQQLKPPTIHARSSRVRARTMILGAVICAAVLGVTTLVWSRTTATETGTGLLTVESEPGGATVSVDGQRSGVTPLSLRLATGKHLLVLRRGERNQELSVAIARNVTTVHHITWPSELEKGALRVISEGAPGAVAVDNMERGTTPVTVDGLSTGDHEIIFRGNGEVQRRMIRVEAGATASLVFVSRSLGRSLESGWLAVAADAPLQIFEGGKLMGTTDSERVMLPAGDHTFTFANSALGFNVTQNVKIAADRTVSVPIAFPRAPVNVNATPWAQVWIDGQSIGDTPIANLPTTIGSHEMIFRHPQLGERRITAVITLKEPARVAVDMTKPQ